MLILYVIYQIVGLFCVAGFFVYYFKRKRNETEKCTKCINAQIKNIKKEKEVLRKTDCLHCKNLKRISFTKNVWTYWCSEKARFDLQPNSCEEHIERECYVLPKIDSDGNFVFQEDLQPKLEESTNLDTRNWVGLLETESIETPDPKITDIASKTNINPLFLYMMCALASPYSQYNPYNQYQPFTTNLFPMNNQSEICCNQDDARNYQSSLIQQCCCDQNSYRKL